MIVHHAGVLGEGGSSQQSQAAREAKQTVLHLHGLHLGALGPLRVVLVEPAEFTFRVAAFRRARQDAIGVSGESLWGGRHSWSVVLGCRVKIKIRSNYRQTMKTMAANVDCDYLSQ